MQTDNERLQIAIIHGAQHFQEVGINDTLQRKSESGEEPDEGIESVNAEITKFQLDRIREGKSLEG